MYAIKFFDAERIWFQIVKELYFMHVTAALQRHVNLL